MNRKVVLTLIASTLFLFLGTLPAAAGGLSIFGAYWETDATDDTAGGGIAWGIPLGDSGLDLDLRATYYEELVNQSFTDALEAIVDDDDLVFTENSLEVLPLDLGLRFNFAPNGIANFYVGGGASYILLDTDFGEVDDEFGFYALGGASFGDQDGAAFFVEAIYRKIEGSVATDPNDFDDIDDIDFIDDVAVDLDGVGANAGIRWRF